MALSIVNNTASLNAQQSLNKTSSSLSKSLERLSTGLKVNRGADGPAALVISEQQRAQIAGLQTAIDNTNKAVSVVQTAEGALNEVNGLLTKIRSLALDSANAGVNDSNALAANQAEITNALSTIDNIANTTQFGTKKLLDGSAAATSTLSGTNNANIASTATGASTTAGSYTVAITTQGTAARTLSTAVDSTAGTTVGGSGGSLVVAGGSLTAGVTVSLAANDTILTTAQKIQASLDSASTVGGGLGKFTVSVDNSTPASARIVIQSNVLGSSAITTTASSTAVQTATGFSTGGTTGTAGTALVGTINGVSVTGSGAYGNQLVAPNSGSGIGGAAGLSITLNTTTANAGTITSAVTSNAAAASSTTVNVTGTGLVFQIGANANQTASIAIQNVQSNNLGVNVTGLSNNNTNSLSKVDVTTQKGANDAIQVVDKAISDISNLRGSLGAFQANTLEANARNLQTTLANTTAAESVIRDTDFASEIANFTRLQTQVQAGSTVLGNANQTTQLVAQLLRG